jgi:hypothetical protein
MSGLGAAMKPAHMTDYRVITAGILRQNAQISPK